MILFFGNPTATVYAVQVQQNLTSEDTQKLNWLFGNTSQIDQETVEGDFVGPRAAMVTPWSTNAVEITQNMGIDGIIRIEEFYNVAEGLTDFDPMLSQKYPELHQDIYDIHLQPEKVIEIEDIEAYNQQEGLALNKEEVNYLDNGSKNIWEFRMLLEKILRPVVVEEVDKMTICDFEITIRDRPGVKKTESDTTGQPEHQPRAGTACRQLLPVFDKPLAGQERFRVPYHHQPVWDQDQLHLSGRKRYRRSRAGRRPVRRRRGRTEPDAVRRTDDPSPASDRDRRQRSSEQQFPTFRIL